MSVLFFFALPAPVALLLIFRFVPIPFTPQMAINLVTLNPDLFNLANIQRVNAVDNMTPGNRFIQVLSTIPVAPGIASNSIVAGFASLLMTTNTTPVFALRAYAYC